MTQKPRLHRDWIDPDALRIVEALQQRDFTTYLVGGCVRDLLLGIQPKDYDIATDARPNQVRRIVPNAYVIGKRFRLVLVKREDRQYEVSTFRRNLRENEDVEDTFGADNIFGTPEEDALRRDFTINALFYDPVADRLIDYSEGGKDLRQHLIRIIGDSDLRLKEDPIRILRAIRLAHKIGFSIETHLRQSMARNAGLLKESALPRRREEFLKWLKLDDPSLAFMDAFDLGVLGATSPHLHSALASSVGAFETGLRAFHDIPLNTDDPGELFGALVRLYLHSRWPDSGPEVLHNPGVAEELTALMRDELGMFKSEQHNTLKAFSMQYQLAKRAEFERKGRKRQLALLRNECFDLALRFAELEYLTSPQDVQFWQGLKRDLQGDLEHYQKARRRRRRRPRRSGPPRAGRESAKGVG